MTLTPEQKEQVIDFIEIGDQLKAVRYLKETLLISSDQALILAEKLEAELETPQDEEGKTIDGTAGKSSGINISKVVGTIFMVVGVIELAVMTYLIVSHYKFEQRAQPVMGRLINYSTYESKNDKGGGYTTMYTPIYEYSFNDKSYQYKSSTSSSSRDYEINEMVEVLVDPQDPQNPLINTFWEIWFLSILMGFMGVMFGGLGYLAYRFLG